MIYYISNININSGQANVIQQLKTTEAIDNLGVDIEFIHPSYKLFFQDDGESAINTKYDITNDPQITRLRTLPDYGKLGRASAIIMTLIWIVRKLLLLQLGSKDIIYIRCGNIHTFSIVFLLRILPKFVSPKIFVEYHNTVQFTSPILVQKVINRVNGIVVITHELKNEMSKNYDIDGVPVHVAPDGVNLDKYGTSKDQARAKLSIPRNRKVVTYTGSFQKRKGVYILIEASHEIKARVLIVGAHESEVDKNRLTRDIPENLEFCGKIAHSEVKYYQIASDILVAPYTRKSWMPSPLKLFEYMAAGNPIVASDLQVLREVLNNNENSILVSPGNSKELANNVNRLLQNPSKMKKLASQALNDAKRYTWEKRAYDISNFFIEH